MTMPRLLLLAALSVACATVPITPPQRVPRGDLAVLPPTLQGDPKPMYARLFAGAVRSAAANELTPAGYSVFDENALVSRTQERGIDPGKAACETSCAIDFANAIDVQAGVTGSFEFEAAANTFYATVVLFDAKSRATVKVLRFGPSGDVHALIEQFDAAAPRFFRDGLAILAPDYVRQLEAYEAAQREKERRDRLAEEELKNPAGVSKANPIADLGGRLVVRGGLGAIGGVAGVGVEWHLPNLAFGVGYGRYLSGGITWKPWSYIGRTKGGLYVDFHVAKRLQSATADQGAGLTIGWDLRPVNWISLKAGAGFVYSTLWTDAQPRPLVADLSAGLVF